MARQKATVTLDRDKVEQARALIGGRSMSEVIDVALGRLIGQNGSVAMSRPMRVSRRPKMSWLSSIFSPA